MKKLLLIGTLLEEINMLVKKNTFIIPIIRKDFIGPCLETLWKYTPPNFYVFIIDQTGDSEAYNKYKDLTHLWVHSYRNLGFSKAINTGFALCQTEYMTALNDDVEFISPTWWQGVEDTFAMDEKIKVVNPNSPKEGAWGYGLTQDNIDTWVPREGFVRDEDGKSVIPVIDGIPMSTPELAIKHYDGLLNRHPIWNKDSLCDGLACWCTVFKRSILQEVGLFDERFYPGGGEDYDMMARIYSKGLRAVGTTKSWVWHWWGKSKDDISGKDPENPLFSRPRWNDLEEIWGPDFDVWGHVNLPDGTKKPLVRLLPPLTDEL